MKKILTLAFGVASYAIFFFTFLYAIGFLGNVVVPKSLDSGATRPWPQAVAMDLALAQGTTLLVGAAALATTAALSWNLAVVFVRWPQFTTAARAALAAVRAGGSVPAEPEALL